MPDTPGIQGTKVHKGQVSSPCRWRGVLRTALVCLVAFVTLSGSANAELAFFANGRFISIKSHETDGESLVLTLRNGGQMIVAPGMIARFEPDEVPYPEPAAEPSAATPAPAAASAAVPYGEFIDKYSKEQGVDARLVRAMIQVESAYKQGARSRKGAMGLMQLMPETARQYAVRDPYDPESNIEAGVKHLKSLLTRLPVDLALAAYNAGEAAVQKFRGIPPYPETRSYVSRILSIAGR
jgi:soluble lytic murein transglycosylase-like protein